MIARLPFALLLILGQAVIVAAQTPEKPAAVDAPIDRASLCAKVDDIPIRYGDIERERKRQIKVKSIGAAPLAIVDASIREQLIERFLALAALQRLGKAASKEDIDFELSRWKQELATQGSSLEEHLAKEQMTEADLRRDLLWRLSWKRYLDEYLTEANLEKFFKEHAADYDGRKVRVAQILLKLPPDAAAEARAAALKKATELREAIVAKQETFAEAAKKHSEAPSAKEGGDQGFIERREPMGEAFSKAAFALEVGETSPPVTTSFGVHLIHCLEIEPGKKTWRDARAQLERDAAAFLAHWLADSQRGKSDVQRTDILPAAPKMDAEK